MSRAAARISEGRNEGDLGIQRHRVVSDLGQSSSGGAVRAGSSGENLLGVGSREAGRRETGDSFLGALL